jgi:hypothetical protein
VNAADLITIVAVDVLFAVVCALIARSKGRSMAWALLALVVPLFALIIVLVLPRKTPPTYVDMQPLNPPPPPPPPIAPGGEAT